MEIRKALEIRKAIITLSDALDIKPKDIALNICFLDEEKYKILVAASETWEKFSNVDVVTRGKMLGIEITEVQNKR